MASVEIDVGMHLDFDGTIYTTVYLGEGSSEPVIEEPQSLKSLIESLLHACTIPGGADDDKIASSHHNDCEQLLKNLKEATKYAKKRIKELT